MPRARVIFISMFLLVGAGCLSKPSVGGPVFCDYQGQRYEAGQTRAAEDLCNVCTCGENGWTCTRHVCLASDAGGRITGKLSYPSHFVPAQRVCALGLTDGAEYCTETQVNASDYAINVPAGRYAVYATRTDQPEGQKAYHSEFVRCGLRAECTDHTPIVIEVTDGNTVSSDPVDWYAQAAFESFVLTPSKYEFGAANYYPDSDFQAMTRGMARVEVYASTVGQEPALLGEAIKVGDRAGGVQVWRFRVPAGFTAADVYALGTSEDSSIIRSFPIGKVVPVPPEAPPQPVIP